MGIFSNSTPFDSDVEKITDEKNTSEDWGVIVDFCDRVKAAKNGPKDCLRSVVKRLNHPVPHVVLQAVTLLDACVNNCGKQFQLEVASRDFENDFRKVLAKSSHPKVREKLISMLRKWSETDFKGDPQLALIPGLYASLKAETTTTTTMTGSWDSPKKKEQSEQDRRKEEDDIATAIRLSLERDNNNQQQQLKLYPSAAPSSVGAAVSAPSVVEEKKARALYDFEAAEDNELTFKAGEVVMVSDDSDANWWKGSNQRGEGLFPANFVTLDADEPPPASARQRSVVQFNEEVEVKVVHRQEEEELAPPPPEISEDRIDRVLSMLNEADPTLLPEDDPSELAAEECRVNVMGPLIDAELEAVDRRHAQLARISTELVDALNLYHQLMHDSPQQPPVPNYGWYGMMAVPPSSLPQQQGYPAAAAAPYVVANGPYAPASFEDPAPYGPSPAGPPMVNDPYFFPNANSLPMSSAPNVSPTHQLQPPPQQQQQHNFNAIPPVGNNMMVNGGQAPIAPPMPPLYPQSQAAPLNQN